MCSTPLAIRKTQIKTALSFHLTLVRMTAIKKANVAEKLHSGGIWTSTVTMEISNYYYIIIISKITLKN